MTLFDRKKALGKRDIALGKARHLVQLSGQAHPPVDIEKLAKYLGVRSIIQREADFLHAEACLLPSRNGHTILVRKNASRRRRRFSIAHELGHLIIDDVGVRFRLSKYQKSSDKERLCDEIAAELLMPEEMVRREMFGRDVSLRAITEMSNRFGSSLEATALRLGTLYAETASVAYWEQQRDTLGAKWVVGRPFLAAGTTRGMGDMTFGPVVAYHADQSLAEITSYEWPESEEAITLRCQSISFGEGSHKFVLSILKEEQ